MDTDIAHQSHSKQACTQTDDIDINDGREETNATISHYTPSRNRSDQLIQGSVYSLGYQSALMLKISRLLGVKIKFLL